MLLEKATDLLGQKESLHWDKRLEVKDNFPRVYSEEDHSLSNNSEAKEIESWGLKLTQILRPFLGEKQQHNINYSNKQILKEPQKNWDRVGR